MYQNGLIKLFITAQVCGRGHQNNDIVKVDSDKIKNMRIGF